MEKLTPKQQRFVQEYLVDLNATAAYKRAGYNATGNAAEACASRLLSTAKVRSAIEAAMKARTERTRATADEVVREIERMAMFDPADLTNVKSPEDIRALPEDIRRAIVGWSWDRQGRFTVKMVKEGALEMLGRHHALFKERVEHTGAGGGPIRHDLTGLTAAELAQLEALAVKATAGVAA